MKKRGQASTELMVIIGFILAVTIPFVVNSLQGLNTHVNQEQAADEAIQLSHSIESVANLGQGNVERVELYKGYVFIDENTLYYFENGRGPRAGESLTTAIVSTPVEPTIGDTSFSGVVTLSNNGNEVQVQKTPVIDLITPSSAAVGDSISITGLGYESDVTIYIGGEVASVDLVSENGEEVNADVPSLPSGQTIVIACNSYPEEVSPRCSSAYSINVIGPTPILDALDPNPVPKSSTEFSAFGSNFEADHTAYINDVEVVSTFIDSTEIEIKKPTKGKYEVHICNNAAPVRCSGSIQLQVN